jgi:hypothetical protein
MQIKLADYLDNALPVLLKAIHFLGLYHSKISQSRRRIVPAFSMPPNSISYAAVGAKRTAKISSPRRIARAANFGRANFASEITKTDESRFVPAA